MKAQKDRKAEKPCSRLGVVLSSFLLIILLVGGSSGLSSSIALEETTGGGGREEDLKPDGLTTEDEKGGVPEPPYPIDPDPVIPDPGNLSQRIGYFSEENLGNFVFFDVIERGIADHTHHRFTEENITLFESITVEDLQIFEKTRKDYLYDIRGDRADFRIYDKPSALTRIDVKPEDIPFGEQSISFNIDEEHGEIIGGGPKTVEIDYGEFRGVLMPYGSIEGRIDQMTRRDSYVNYTLTEKTSFVFMLEEKRAYEFIDVFEFKNEAISDGQLGAEVRVEKIENEYHYRTIEYADMKVLSQMINEKTLQMMVSSDSIENGGAIVAADISSTVIDVTSHDDLNVTFDKEPIPEVETYTEMIDRSKEATYILLSGEEGAQIFVNIPSFSSHTIMIEEIVDTEIEDTYLGDILYYLPGIIVAGAVAAIGSIYKKYKNKIKENKEEEDGVKGKEIDHKKELKNQETKEKDLGER